MHNPFENATHKPPPINPFDTHDQKPINPFEDQKSFSPFGLNPQQPMFGAQPGSRPASVMPPGTQGQVPPMMFHLNNAFHPLMYTANGIPNSRVNNWLNNFGSSTPGVPSVISQLSLGAAASQLSLLSQNTKLFKTERDEKFEKADLDFVIRCLSDNFDFLDVEVNKRVLEIIGGVNYMDKEFGKEVADALWKALAKVNYQYLIGDKAEVTDRLELFHELVKQFYKLNRQYSAALNLMDDMDKQRVLQSLLILLRHRFDESILQVLNVVVARSMECQRLLCVRNDPSRPHLDSMITLRRLCAGLSNYQPRQKPRAIHALMNLFLILLTCYRTREELQSRSRLELCEVFTAEGARPVLLLLRDIIQLVVNNNQQPVQQRLSNIEMFESIIRYISRLFFVLSELGLLVDRLIDLEIFELMAVWVQKLNHLSRTGYEARRNTVRTFANLSSCAEKLRKRDLTEAVSFTLDCINQIYQYTPSQIDTLRIQGPETVVRLGTGFLSNVTRYNPRVQEVFTRNENSMNFLIQLGGGCVAFLQQQNLDKSRIDLLTDIIAFCVETVCHLSDSSNPCHQMAFEFLAGNPGILYFTNFALFQTERIKMPLQAVIAILTMWKKCMSRNFFPPTLQRPDQVDITSGLLGFFTQRILDVGRTGQSEQERKHLETALSLAQEDLQLLIENHPPYSQLIEQKLCGVNNALRPFQLLNQLNPTSACLMLKFLCACCRLEQLKQLWSNERDYQGNPVNQQILQQFRQSADQNINMLSSIIYQQIVTGDFSLADAFVGPFP